MFERVLSILSQRYETQRNAPWHYTTPHIRETDQTIQPLDEVKESKDYKALHTRLVADTEALQRRWANEYANVVDGWNDEVLLRRFHLSVCTLLNKAARLFIAQLGIQHYSADEAVMDLLTTSLTTIIGTPLPTDLHTLLTIYKEANNLSRLPTPTVTNMDNTVGTAIDNINLRRKSPPAEIQNDNSTASTLTASITATEGRGSSPPPANDASTTEDTTLPAENESTITPASQQHTQNNPSTTADAQIPPSTTTTPTTTTTPPNPYRTSTGPPPSKERGDTRTTPATVERQSQPPPPPRDANGQFILPARPEENSLPPGTSILWNNRHTGFITPSPYNPQQGEYQQQQESPRFSYSPIDPYSPSFTQNEEELDDSLAAIDLNLLISTTTGRKKIQAMLLDLFCNAIKKPLTEFHNTVTQQEELSRIKQVTTMTAMESTAAKVIAKIQAEEPANQPVLKGLIRQETAREVSSMKRQLQAALDSIAMNTKKLKTLTEQNNKMKQPQRNNTGGSHITTGSKNMMGGNIVWSRTLTSHQARSSTAAAEYSSTTQPNKAQPQSRTMYNPRAQTYTTAQAGSIVNMSTNPSQQNDLRNTHTSAVDNVTAAKRRKRNNSRSRNKSNGRNNN